MTGTIRPTEEQQAVIDCWGMGMAVTAGAGSGKTTTLVMKCRELLARKPDARFAAVSFTERSAGDLRKKLSKHLSIDGEGGALSGHWVMTIHGLCGAILREYPREAGFDGEETMLSESEAQLYWERALESIWQETLPPDLNSALETLLARESRDSLFDLLRRARDLELFGMLDSLARSADESSRDLHRVSAHVLEKYERLKRRRGVLDFNDLERGADRVLENENIRALFHRRFDLVLVDEFQDTNPVQARIVRRLVRPDFSNLCVVGDPKQSIYRFRDADVSVFSDFCSRLPKCLPLTWNFRSRPGIIEYANGICSRTFEASGMEYLALHAGRAKDEALEPVIRLDVKDPADLARWVLAEVEKGLPLQEMALLVRKIRGNEKWFKALSAAGVPLAMGSGGLFWEDPRTRELVAFLRWWDHPANALSGAVFLRAPWVGVADADIDRWVQKDPTLHQPFFDSNHPTAKALAPFRGKVVRPGELLLALLADENTENELGAPLLGLWHRVEELSSRGLDFHSVVTEISLMASEKRRERDVPPPKNEGQLQVLTLHGAKGLEFRHVILIDLGKKGRTAPAPLLFWDREKGAYLGRRDPGGERDKKNPEEAAWRDLEKKKNIAESKRLFYVALTRAMERLVLVCPTLEEDADFEGALEQDFWRGWIEEAGGNLYRAEAPEKARELAIAPYAKAAIQPLGEKFFRRIRPRHSVTEWNLLTRCPRAYEWTYIRPRLSSLDERDSDFTAQFLPREDGEGMSQRELGTRVHALLEVLDFEGLRELEKEAGSTRFSSQVLVDWAKNSPWMKPAEPGGLRRTWTELAFEIPLDGEVLVGAIDRLVQDDENLFRIIDFKVTASRKTPEELLSAYQPQMELYSWAVKSLAGKASGETRIEAHLVHIASDSVQIVDVPLQGLDCGPLRNLAAEIVRGTRPAEPKPGSLCRVCAHRKSCPDAQLAPRF